MIDADTRCGRAERALLLCRIAPDAPGVARQQTHAPNCGRLILQYNTCPTGIPRSGLAAAHAVYMQRQCRIVGAYSAAIPCYHQGNASIRCWETRAVCRILHRSGLWLVEAMRVASVLCIPVRHLFSYNCTIAPMTGSMACAAHSTGPSSASLERAQSRPSQEKSW